MNISLIKEVVMDLNAPQFYFNRELSWLRFNSRVLAQSLDCSLPPLERLKFLAIYGTNLDEFYMIRVAGLKTLFEAGIQECGADKLTPVEQLDSINKYIHKEQDKLEKSYTSIVSKLDKYDVAIKDYSKLSSKQKIKIRDIFFKQIYPVIIPIAVDSTHPFPHFNNLSFGLALTLKDSSDKIKYALIRIPRILPRFIKIDNFFVPIDSIVDNFSNDIFSGLKKIASTTFRVTRNADIEIEEEEADDFMEILEEGVRSRNKGRFVRLELLKSTDTSLIKFLKRHLKLEPRDIYYYKNIPLDLGSLWLIVGDKELSYLTLPSFKPKTLAPFDNENIFKAIEEKDVLLYHPYDSFEPVVKFIQQASKDPNTLSIRMTLYRVGANSPIVKALIDAVRDDKQVTVLVELKARFDEQNNLQWAKILEDAGAHVVYGIKGLKVHAKIAQVIKKDGSKLKSYLHLATGNYNPFTSKIYTDMSYFTTKESFTDDATRFFHFLTGFSTEAKLDKLFMSPTQIKPKLISLIKNEAKEKENGHIILKSNSLVDTDIIKALYKASQNGCKINLIIRGICCLKPEIQGISENIIVHSIIGKYLEHPRVYYFKNDKVKVYISSADLMPRNLIRRVELLTPIEELHLSNKIEQILKLQLKDNKLRWILKEDGSYQKINTSAKEINNHQELEKYVSKLEKKQKQQIDIKYVDELANKLLEDS